MKQFLRFFLASILGTTVTLLIFLLLLFGLIAGMASFSSKPKVEVKEKTVLRLTIDRDVIDRAPNNPFQNYNWQSMESEESYGLNELIENLRKAKEDPKISGILLEVPAGVSGLAIAEELRSELESFKSSGKFLISYANSYSQGGYYLASVAETICMHPEGNLEFKGLMADLVFFKHLLEKIDVEAQIIRHGKYKSAVEPFMLDKMSPENREQTQQLVSTIWNNMVAQISKSRGISVERLNQLADSLTGYSAEKALQVGLVDKLVYKDELEKMLRQKLGADSTAELNFMSMTEYFNAPEPVKKKVDRTKKIAVIYALGDVVDGKGDETSIGIKNIPEALRKAREDKKIKAVVLRVNSGGGSALTSDIIWRELELTRKEKPVIASFGDVAGSGGYYIACNASKIFANPNSITGSIGVLGIIPNAQKLLSDRLGITFDNVKTNANAEFVGLNRPLTDYQKRVLLNSIEDVYATFVGHVAEGRKLTREKVDSIGQGRVWSGVDAKSIGLIDEWGGLYDAIAEAAKMAGIENYKIVEYPVLKDPFTRLLESFGGEENSEVFLKKQLGIHYNYLKTLQNLATATGPQARMPFQIHFR
ncbi:MAG: protease [Bacteroidales bacterium]|jgi:protease-4|nr:protease [Bacteroidales bacterium]MDN5329174.1 protease [Bacteroidales bacterium]